ncbi:MAG: GNAT family N-acetyltransferase [Proteobacteria bacterium]|nr:GNAT family N-acetyltransferase [Pseudomonadota bacterium]
MSGFDLRPMGALDLDRAAALHSAAFAPLGERAWTRQDVAELMASPGVGGILLSADGEEVGFALCRVAADEAELLTIAVDQAHRRRGAGRALLDAVIARARDAGAASLFLEVGVDNPGACSLYGQKDFQTVGRRVGYYRRGDGAPADAIVMRLALTRDGFRRGG